MIWINFETIRQFFYCKRIVYFRYVVKFQGFKSYKMKKGVEYHSMKIKRKTKGIISNFWLESHELRIRGFVDAIELIDEGQCFIIDYKQKVPYKNKIPEHYKAQLVAEALAIEKTLKMKIKNVIIKLPGGNRIIEPISQKEVKDVLNAMNEIREIIVSETIPEPTIHKKKCIDCEYKKICVPI